MRIQRRQGNSRSKFPTSKIKIRVAVAKKDPYSGEGTKTLKKSRKPSAVVDDSESTFGQSSQSEYTEAGKQRYSEARQIQDRGHDECSVNLGEDENKTPARGITLEDMKYNFLNGRLSNLLQVWPFILNKETGKFKHNGSKLNEFMVAAWFFLPKIHIFQATVQTLFLVLNMEDWTREVLRLSLVAMIISVVAVLTNAYTHVISVQRDTYIVVYNTLVGFQADVNAQAESESLGPHSSATTTSITTTTGNEWRIKSLIRSIRNRSFRQNFLIYLPFIMFPTILLFPGLQVVDPANPILVSSLYHIIKQDLKTIHWTISSIGLILYAALLLCDILVAYLYACITYQGVAFMLLFQLKAVEMAQVAVQQLENHIQSGLGRALGIENARTTLHALYLVIRLFNECFCRTVYLTKIVALLLSILGGFGIIMAIRLGQYTFAPIFALWCVESVIIYNTLFGSAYKLTDKVEDLKGMILTESGQLQGNKILQTGFSRFLRAIPMLGVQDGAFGLMDRLVLFNFMDFVISQLIDLVITFI